MVRTARWKYVVRTYYRTYDVNLARYGYPLLFLTLLAAAAAASVFRVELPLSQHGATMSLSFAFELAALLLLGAHAATVIAASGAWVNDTTFIVKLVGPETPFYSIMTFRFEGDKLVLDGEYNVNFGPTKQPQLTGVLARP